MKYEFEFKFKFGGKMSSISSYPSYIRWSKVIACDFDNEMLIYHDVFFYAWQCVCNLRRIGRKTVVLKFDINCTYMAILLYNDAVSKFRESALLPFKCFKTLPSAWSQIKIR